MGELGSGAELVRSRGGRRRRNRRGVSLKLARFIMRERIEPLFRGRIKSRELGGGVVLRKGGVFLPTLCL